MLGPQIYTCNSLVLDCFLVMILPTLFFWPGLDWFAMLHRFGGLALIGLQSYTLPQHVEFFAYRHTILSVILVSVFSMCTFASTLFVQHRLKGYDAINLLDDIKMPIWSFRIAKLLCSSLAKRRLVPYGLSHTVTHSSRTELASEFNIHAVCCFSRSDVGS